MSSATTDLKAALSALSSILEATLPTLEAGSISPEIFRLAKNEDKTATPILIALIRSLLMETNGTDDILKTLNILKIATPKNMKNSSSLLTVRHGIPC